MKSSIVDKNSNQESPSCLLNRRKFLLRSGSAVAISVMPLAIVSQTGESQSLTARVANYSRKQLAKVSDLKVNEAIEIHYPDEGTNSSAILVKLGVKAGGGIGPDSDIVAFSYFCSHQGGPLQGTYKAVDEHRILGPCPFHLSSFDLTRHGILIAGQAYQSLPQIVLEVENETIIATGVMGLIFGRTDNLITMG